MPVLESMWGKYPAYFQVEAGSWWWWESGRYVGQMAGGLRGREELLVVDDWRKQ